MPNHIDTILTVTGPDEHVKAFRETHFVMKDEKKYDGTLTGEKFLSFDFNTITPCHEDLTKAVAPTRTGEELYNARNRGDSEESILELMKEIKLADDNVKKYGHPHWYSFCNKEWGTKWGAYDVSITEEIDGLLVVRYQTAWSPATPILKKLSTMYPDLKFDQHVLDEGMCFGGTQSFHDGYYKEEMYDGDELYAFCNKEFDSGYIKCECGEWFNPEWAEDGHQETLCYECNEAL